MQAVRIVRRVSGKRTWSITLSKRYCSNLLMMAVMIIIITVVISIHIIVIIVCTINNYSNPQAYLLLQIVSSPTSELSSN